MRAPPAYVQDDSHHGGWVIILTAVGLVFLVLSLLIRLYVRLRYRSILHTADGVLAVAGLFAIVQSCLVFWEVSKGLGTSPELLNQDDVRMLQKSNFAATVLYLFTVYLSKCCVICVYLHLSLERSVRRVSYAVLTLATAWILCSTLMIGIDCALLHPWIKLASRCSDMMIRWQIVTGVDVTIEILLFLLSIYLMAGTKIPWKRKSIVITAFGIRLLVIIPTLLRLHFLDIQIHSSKPVADAVVTLIWTEIQLHFSVICAVTYCFRSFTAAVSTNYGCAVINLDAYEETNGNLTAYTSSRKSSKPDTTSDQLEEKFVGHNGRYSCTTIITAGEMCAHGCAIEPGNNTLTTMIIVQEEVDAESSRASSTAELTVESV